jgi:hypothetical protein
MRLIKMECTVEALGYGWICPKCFKGASVVESTPLCGMSLRTFDICVNLFAAGSIPIAARNKFICESKSSIYMLLIRKCYAHYWKRHVLPYIKLPGPVEMDETMIGRHNGALSSTLKLKWAFGMVCRQTQIPIIFYIVRKTHWLLSTITKAYTVPGSTIFTDAHSSYCTLQNSTSKFSQYGYYHYWINHSAEYVHSKYPFLNT